MPIINANVTLNDNTVSRLSQLMEIAIDNRANNVLRLKTDGREIN
jgi:hypothetical protein